MSWKVKHKTHFLTYKLGIFVNFEEEKNVSENDESQPGRCSAQKYQNKYMLLLKKMKRRCY